MRILHLSLFSFALISCAHVKEHPKIVELPFAQDLVLKVQERLGRSPASTEENFDFSDKSVRRIYFSSLYHQFTTLGHFLGLKPLINSCPQFHHDKLERDRASVSQLSIFKPSEVVQDRSAFFPELAFSKDFSMKDYHASLREEVELLCEEGISDNYYKFDNLVTHYSHRTSFHRSPSAMASVLKIPVFANFYLLKMLEVPGLEMTTPEEKVLFKLTKTHWFETYVHEASRIRNSLIKNKTVRK